MRLNQINRDLEKETVRYRKGHFLIRWRGATGEPPPPHCQPEPNSVIIVDAVDIGSRPGTVKLFSLQQIPQGSFSTLRLFLTFL